MIDHLKKKFIQDLIKIYTTYNAHFLQKNFVDRECMPPNCLSMCAAMISIFQSKNDYFYAKFKTMQRYASIVTCFQYFSEG